MKSIRCKSTAQVALSALLLMTASSHGATLLLSDNFTTANSTDLNVNLAARQDGTLEGAGSNYTALRQFCWRD